MDGTVTALVSASLTRSGLTLSTAARRAGVSPSTLHRVLAGKVDPSVGTVRSILRACGAELRLDDPPLADPRAAAAARALLEDGYDPDGLDIAEWSERLVRWAEDDFERIVDEAGRASGVMHRPGRILLAGRPTLGRLASAGAASRQRWAISGVPGLTLRAFEDAVDPIALVWCDAPRDLAQLLAGDDVRETTSLRVASVILLSAEPELFLGGFVHDQVSYASPLQIMLDCISLGGSAADAARAEVGTW